MKTPMVRLASREELIAYVPYGLGFHPRDSIVMLGLGPTRVELCARADADWPQRELVRQFAQSLRRVPVISRIFLFGYGPGEIAGPAGAVAVALKARGFQVLELLRVSENRFWCLRCDDCTPPDGAPYDPASSATAAAATYAGIIARPDRAAVEKMIRPIGGIAAIGMTQAVDRAERQLDALAGKLRDAGAQAVDQAFAAARAGLRLTDDEVAWLTLLLHDSEVRDHAWKHTGKQAWQSELWLELTRRAEPPLAAPVASLLAWSAWRRGDGPLAMVAVDRALRIDPGCCLALFVLGQLEQARPPSAVKSWPFPLG